jgi:S-adenosylmethionine hydrolase
MAAAYLLRAYGEEFPLATVFLAVVDPGVGGPRLPAVVEAGGRWYVGPDNGLFEMVVRQVEETARWWEITWRPERLSATFHGRDLFAPVAARIAGGEAPAKEEWALGLGRPISEIRRPRWPDDLFRVIYVDGFGNLVTGIRAASLTRRTRILAAGRNLERAATFGDVPPGKAFWYENANGLAEISVNQGSAVADLGLELGSEITIDSL